MSTVPNDDAVDKNAAEQNEPVEPTTVVEPDETQPAPAAEPVEPTFTEPGEAPLASTPNYDAPPAPPAPPAVSSVAAAASEGPAHADPAPLIEPPTPEESAAIDDAIAQSATLPGPDPVEAAVAEPSTAAETVEAPVVETTAEPVAVAPVPVVPAQTVYVEAPQPPRKKGNRGVGMLWVVLGTIIFAALFALAIFIVTTFFYSGSLTVMNLLTSSAFIVPVVVFFVAFVIAVLLINRAGWWAWVIGSLLVAAAVYFGSIGAILLLENVVGMTPSEASAKFAELAVSAPIILATVLAREVAMWFGAAIASRGRKVKARNAEARTAYDRELAESRTTI